MSPTQICKQRPVSSPQALFIQFYQVDFNGLLEADRLLSRDRLSDQVATQLSFTCTSYLYYPPATAATGADEGPAAANMSFSFIYYWEASA